MGREAASLCLALGAFGVGSLGFRVQDQKAVRGSGGSQEGGPDPQRGGRLPFEAPSTRGHLVTLKSYRMQEGVTRVP
jgi:hypothetical protein